MSSVTSPHGTGGKERLCGLIPRRQGALGARAAVPSLRAPKPVLPAFTHDTLLPPWSWSVVSVTGVGTQGEETKHAPCRDIRMGRHDDPSGSPKEKRMSCGLAH